jgi:hypothetical protein
MRCLRLFEFTTTRRACASGAGIVASSGTSSMSVHALPSVLDFHRKARPLPANEGMIASPQSPAKFGEPAARSQVNSSGSPPYDAEVENAATRWPFDAASERNRTPSLSIGVNAPSWSAALVFANT